MRQNPASAILRFIFVVLFIWSSVPDAAGSKLQYSYLTSPLYYRTDTFYSRYKILLAGEFPKENTGYYFKVIWSSNGVGSTPYTSLVRFNVNENQLCFSGGGPNPDCLPYPGVVPDRTFTGSDVNTVFTFTCDGLLWDGGGSKIVGRVTGDLATVVSFENQKVIPFTGITIEGIATVMVSLDPVSCDTKNCDSCAPGSVKSGLKSIDLSISLGKAWRGESGGSLKLLSDLPAATMARTSALLPVVGPDFEVINSNGVRQVLGPQVLADVLTNNAYKYNIYFYARTNVGTKTNGLYTVTNGTHYKVITVENPDTTNGFNRLFVSDVQSGITNAIAYTYTNSTSSNQLWTLTTYGGLYKETIATTWANTNHTERTEIHSILQPTNDTVVFRERKKYQRLTFGDALVEHALDPDGANLLSTFSYYTNTAATSIDRQRLGQLKDKTLPDGSWVRYDYGDSGRVTTNVTCFLNNSITASNGQVRAVYTTYSTANPVETRIEKLLNQEVARTYKELGTDVMNQIQCQTVGAATNSSDNLRTVTKFYPKTDASFPRRIKSIQRPDRTMSFYTYSTNASNVLTTTVTTGQTNGAGTAIQEGFKQITVIGSVGQAVSNLVLNITGGSDGAVLSRESSAYASGDDFFRSPMVTYLDGYTTQVNYDCCHLDNTVDKDGTVTTYSFDDLDRQTATTRNGVTITNVLDAAGRILQTIRIGTDSSQITLRSAKYDVAGLLISETNALSGVTTYTNIIDGSGQTVKTNTYPDGGTLVETYAKDGSLLKVTGTAAHPVRYDYGVESEGGVQRAYTQEIKLDGSGSDTGEWTKTYTDLLGRAYKTIYTSASGTPNRQSFFNNYGQLWKTVDPDSVTNLFAYNAKGEQEYSAVDLNNNGLINTNGTDRITRTILDVVTNSVLGANVNRTRTLVWSTDNVDTSNLVSSVEASVEGLKTASIIWNSGSGVTNLTRSGYDAANGYRLVTNTAPDGSYTITTNQNGLVISVTRRDSTGAQIGQTTYAYDPHERQTTITDARTGATSQYFNNADQVSGVVTPSPTQATTNYFDSLGRIWKITLPDSTSVTNEFFLTGELKKTYGSRTYPVEYTYDAQGRMLTMKTWKDFAGNSGTATTTWNYDGYRGWLTNKVYDGSSAGPGYSYTAAGRPTTRAWARGISTTYTYNGAGDLSGVDYSDSTADVSYTYDRRGRQATVVCNGMTTTLAYNDANELVSESYSGGSLSGLSLTNGYDSLLRRTTVGLSNYSGTLTTYGYDTASRLQTVTSGTNTASYAYLANSPLISQIAFTNGSTQRMVTTKSYDNLNRLTNLVSAAGATTVASFAYQYNSANQRTQRTDSDASYWVYLYDSLGQVTSGKKYWSDGTPVAGQQFEYGFDDIGNRESTAAGGDQFGANLRSANYTNNALNQITSRGVPGYVDVLGSATNTATVTVNDQATYRYNNYFRAELTAANTSPLWFGVTNLAVVNNGTNADIVASTTGFVFVAQSPEGFGYDADGNMTNDGRWLLTWDAENRLTKAESLGSTPAASRRKVEWTYDCRGRRVRQTTYDGSSGSYVATEDLKFLSDGWRHVAELNATNDALVRSYVWGLDLSGSPDGAGGVGGLLMLNSVANGTQFYAYDGNGNVVALVKATDGSTSANYEFDPFGQTLRATGTMASENRFRFSTKRTDSATDFVLYEYRIYVPSTGRWLSRDPFGENGGLNLHGFVYNNPMGFVDSLGLYEIDVHFYLTYWLASKIPCFTGAEARQIANADQGTDENLDTSPGLGSTEKQREQNRKYHALHPPGDGQNYLGELWGDATERPIGGQRRYSPSDPPMQMRRNCDLNALGIYLHHLQDTFSHSGFTSDFIGHGNPAAFWRWHRPDKTEADYAKSSQMAAATWNALQEWVKICRCQCYNDKLKGKNLFVAPMGQQLTDFLKESGGPRSFEIGEDELKKKRKILGVNPRY